MDSIRSQPVDRRLSRVIARRIVDQGGRVLVPMAVSCCLLVGCDKSPHDVAPVQGTVTIDGRPMTHGKVMFAPMAEKGGLNPGKPAFGIIDSEGHFALSTYGDQDGAVVGVHSATVINTPPSTSIATSSGPDVERVPKFKRVLVPMKFSVVAGQDNQFDIELTSRQIAQYGS